MMFHAIMLSPNPRQKKCFPKKVDRITEMYPSNQALKQETRNRFTTQ